MSYSTQSGPKHQKQGKYAPHFCGKCNLALRGWDITSAGMGKKSKGTPAPKGPSGSLVVEVKTPAGDPVAGAEVELAGGAKKKTDKAGKADFGKVEAKTHEIKVRKKGYGPPAGADPFEFGDGELDSFDVVEGEEHTATVELLTVKSIAISHTPANASKPERIYKANKSSIEILHEVVATVSAPVAKGTGKGTQARVHVEWTFTADAGNCPKNKGGKDDTQEHFVSVSGFPATGDLRTRAVTTTGDDGVTKVQFSSSVVAGDRFTVHAKVIEDGKAVVSADSPQFEVWKLLEYKGLLMMETGTDKGVDVGAVCTEARIQPAYTPCFTEYRPGPVTKIPYKEFLSDLAPPTAVQQPVSSAVTVKSDGADVRKVKIEGLVVAADGSTSAGSEELTLNGPTAVTGTTKFQKVERAVSTADAARTISIAEAAGAKRAIGTIGKNGTSATLNFLFDTDAAVTVKAKAWYDANESKMDSDLNAFSTPGSGFQFIGAAYVHPKIDGRSVKTTFYKGYPAVRITPYGGVAVHPDSDWYDNPGLNIGRKSFICLNANGDAYKTVVARHEIGHGADTENFGGPGDPDPMHCPKTSCLMYYAAQGDQFCAADPEHSQHRMRGWKR